MMMMMMAFYTTGLLVLVTMATGFQMPEQPGAGGKLWAVLVAGSNSYDNYRHQADVCHAYQILHTHGIPDSQIIVMMYDDIARNPANPTKGIIINRPNGTNIYNGVPRDYTKDEVTPANFLNVLLGNKQAMKGIGSGKVLQSGPNDHVFVNFADHGAPGILAFPDDELSVSDLQKTIKKMHAKKMYNKLVFYVEACESGSMFANVLPANINVYAATAANSKESSYACYPDDYRGTYLGDLFSVSWMEDSDVENLGQEKISKQFKIVKKETNLSHVMHYGDLRNPIPAPDVPLAILKMKLRKANAINSEDVVGIQRKIHRFKQNRAFLDKAVDEIITKSVATAEQSSYAKTERLSLHNLECYEPTARYFSENCFALSKNDYALRQMYIFVNLCEMGVKARSIMKAMDLVCTHPSVYGIH